eukprot:Gb_25673 [translate_table: standard]
MKRSSKPEEKRLRAQDCIKLASGSKSNVDMDVGSLPYSFSSRIHCHNRELGNGDKKPSVVVGIAKIILYLLGQTARNKSLQDAWVVTTSTLLLKLFCGCNKDIKTVVENSNIQIDISNIEGSNGMVLEGLAECISCSGNDIQEYALCRNAVNVLAFITASGNMSVGCLLSSMPSGCKDAQRRTNCNDPEKTVGPTIDANIESHVSDAPNDKSVHSEHCAPHSSNVVEQKNAKFSNASFLSAEFQHGRDVSGSRSELESFKKWFR